MEPPDYNFLKTGFKNLIEPSSELSEDEQASIISLMQIYIEEAFKIATGFVIYEKRNIITNQDIVLALKAQSMDHSEVWHNPHTLERVSDVHQELISQPKSTRDLELQEDVLDSKDISQFKLEDNAYNEILTVNTRWRDWNPTEFPYNILKKAIDKTEDSISTVDSV